MKEIIIILVFVALPLLAQTETLQMSSVELNKYSNLSKTLVDNNYRVDSIHSNSGNINISIYKYEENQNLILDSLGYYSGNEWRDISKKSFTYDSLGNKLTDLIEYWNQGGYWMKYNLNQYFYSSQIDSFLAKRRINNNWENNFFLTYKYNSDGNLDTMLFQLWKDTAWVDNSRETNTYNSNGLLVSKLVETWIMPENFWQNSALFTYNYDENGNEVEALEKIWYSNTWHEYRKITSTYNANNQKSSWLQEQKYNSTWGNEKRVVYTYDENDNMNYAYHEVWDNGNSIWNKEDGNIRFKDSSGRIFNLLATEIDVFYNEITAVDESTFVPNQFELKQNYPNPFNPSTTIQFALPKVGMVNLKVYNILGEEVAELINREMNAGFQSINFDASHLSSGLYFYRISAGTSTSSATEFVDVKKMLLLK